MLEKMESHDKVMLYVLDPDFIYSKLKEELESFGEYNLLVLEAEEPISSMRERLERFEDSPWYPPYKLLVVFLPETFSLQKLHFLLKPVEDGDYKVLMIVRDKERLLPPIRSRLLEYKIGETREEFNFTARYSEKEASGELVLKSLSRLESMSLEELVLFRKLYDTKSREVFLEFFSS